MCRRRARLPCMSGIASTLEAKELEKTCEQVERHGAEYRIAYRITLKQKSAIKVLC